MRYLKEAHNYLSLKMKYIIKLEQEFPSLGRKKVDEGGFGHMVETAGPAIEDKDLILEESTEVNIPLEENIPKVHPDDFDYDYET